MEIVKRGYAEKDKIEFGPLWSVFMNAAGEEIFYLLNRGYNIKKSVMFIGNHYLLSKRQRMALARMLSAKSEICNRHNKRIFAPVAGETYHIDGFNTIITLEVALSCSLLIRGLDGALRDLAGLRGTYCLVDKTEIAVDLMLAELDRLGIRKAVIYLDKPVSNSGRLKSFIMDKQEAYLVNISVELLDQVDRKFYGLDCVISADAIVLNKCRSWYNLNEGIIKNEIMDAWIYELDIKYM